MRLGIENNLPPGCRDRDLDGPRQEAPVLRDWRVEVTVDWTYRVEIEQPFAGAKPDPIVLTIPIVSVYRTRIEAHTEGGAYLKAIAETKTAINDVNDLTDVTARVLWGE
jgi:hypothetical protein